MTDDKQQSFERKKKKYRAVYRKEIPYREIKGRTLTHEPSSHKKKRKRKK
jgi:hypothetical protein